MITLSAQKQAIFTGYIAKNVFLSGEFLSCLNFGQVTDIQTEYDAYEPTVLMHRWAKKPDNF